MSDEDGQPGADPDPARRAAPAAAEVIAAHEQADPEALTAVLRDDVRIAISPQVGEWNGRDEVANALRAGMTSLGVWRVLPTAANGQPAAAGYLCRPGQTTFEPFAICLLNFQDGQLVDIAAIEAADLIAAFGLPASPVTTASERWTASEQPSKRCGAVAHAAGSGDSRRAQTVRRPGRLRDREDRQGCGGGSGYWATR